MTSHQFHSDPVHRSAYHCSRCLAASTHKRYFQTRTSVPLLPCGCHSGLCWDVFVTMCKAMHVKGQPPWRCAGCVLPSSPARAFGGLCPWHCRQSLGRGVLPEPVPGDSEAFPSEQLFTSIMNSK